MSAEDRRAFADRFRANCNIEQNADNMDAIMALIEMEIAVVAEAEEHLESNADEGTYDGDPD